MVLAVASVVAVVATTPERSTAKSNVLVVSSYVTVMFVSVLELTIAPTVSEIVSASETPSIVSASVSSVPSISTSPEISNDAAVTEPVVVRFSLPKLNISHQNYR